MALGVSKDVVTSAESMLSDAYELVLSGWCQGAAAEDELGRQIEPSSAFARRWSAPGALERVWRRADGDAPLILNAYERACHALASTVRDAPQRWNDAAERRLDEVLDALALAVDQVQGGSRPPLSLVEELVEEIHDRDLPSRLFAD
jgi:hypothetical protein